MTRRGDLERRRGDNGRRLQTFRVTGVAKRRKTSSGAAPARELEEGDASGNRRAALLLWG